MSTHSPGLLLIGAYRDHEVSLGHPFMLTVEELIDNEAIINRIYLSSLNLNTIIQVIIDTLYCPERLAHPLAELLLFKTGGNPFFLKEFFQSLYTEGLISFNIKTLQWEWDLSEIERQNFTDNIIELMSIKIKKLTEATQTILKFAACIGNQFDLKILARSCEQSIQDAAKNLWGTISAGLIIPINNEKWAKLALIEGEIIEENLPEYKFVHDRVQQAAYSLISQTEQAKIHRKIGKILLENTGDQKQK
jgi:predicted ATPase